MQGLFERHKLIVATQLCIAILRQEGKLQGAKLDFLLKSPRAQGIENPLREFVSDSAWACVMALRELDDYTSLPDDLQARFSLFKVSNLLNLLQEFDSFCCGSSCLLHLWHRACCATGEPPSHTAYENVLTADSLCRAAPSGGASGSSSSALRTSPCLVTGSA